MDPIRRIKREEQARKNLIEELASRASGEDAERLRTVRLDGRLRDVWPLVEMEAMVDIARKLPKGVDTPAEASLDDDVDRLLFESGYKNEQAIREASDEDLLGIKGIGQTKLTEIREVVG